MKNEHILQKGEKNSNININKLIRSNRKTVGIEITDKLELIVRAPHQLSLSEIKDILKRKSKWIDNTREKLKKHLRTANKRSFNIGEIFYLKGKSLKLHSINNGKKKIELKNNNIFLFKTLYDNNLREIFIDWYKKQARDFIIERVKIYSKLTGLQPTAIRITSANKRWGSCSGKNSINFSYRLIMAPIKIIDYVVVHELIHIEEKNHSRKFWQKVENVIPDYRERRRWLKQNGHMLYI